MAVSNFDILNFFLSPLGLLYGAVFCVVAVALLLLEHAGMMTLVNIVESRQKLTLMQMVQRALLRTLQIGRLGALKVVTLSLILLPLTGLAGLTYLLLLTQHDIYFYVTEHPPAYWWALGIGVVLLLIAAVSCAFLLVRWVFALPILLFENQSAGMALSLSRERVEGIRRPVATLLLGWLLGMGVTSFVLTAGFRGVAQATMELFRAEQSVWFLLLLLIIHAVLLTLLSFVLTTGLVLLIRRLYLVRCEQLGISLASPTPELFTQTGSVIPWPRRLLAGSLAAMVISPLLVWAGVAQQLSAQREVEITAHRGHALLAPENTLAAFQKAIDSGADYVELDVHLTKDNVIMVLHDRDLKRVAGVSRQLQDMTYDEVRQLDVGSWFSPEFAGEKIPTLAETIDFCQGRIRINIEMKFFNSDRTLVPLVAELIREKQFEDECIVMSLTQDAVEELRRIHPKLRTGLIVAQALGNIGREEVDVLSVRAEHLTDPVLRMARRYSREVHVWTLERPQQVLQQIQRGVDNVITKDPDMAIRVREEWSELSDKEQLAAALRLLLGVRS